MATVKPNGTSSTDDTQASRTQPAMTDSSMHERQGGRASRSSARSGTRLAERYAVVFVLIALIALFSALKPDIFPTYSNFTSIVSTQDILAIAALGLMLPMACGEFDLSIGPMLGFAGVEVAVLTSATHLPVIPAIAITIATGALVGLVNGLLVVRLRINAFIATLATGSVLTGATIWISKGSVVSVGIPQSLFNLAQNQALKLPLTAFYTLALIVVLYYVMNQTPAGRFLYAIGGGRETARLAGINTGRLIIVAFVFSATLASVAGVLETATSSAADPNIGPSFLLPAFAACFLGSTTIQPGRFNVMGTIVGIALLSVATTGLEQLGIALWVSYVFNGAALLVAVGLAANREHVRSATD